MIVIRYFDNRIFAINGKFTRNNKQIFIFKIKFIKNFFNRFIVKNVKFERLAIVSFTITCTMNWMSIPSGKTKLSSKSSFLLKLRTLKFPTSLVLSRMLLITPHTAIICWQVKSLINYTIHIYGARAILAWASFFIWHILHLYI